MIKSNTKKSASKSNVSTKSAKKTNAKKSTVKASKKDTAFSPDNSLCDDLEGITPVLNDYQQTNLIKILEAVKSAKGSYRIVQKDENSTPWIWIKVDKENKEIIKKAGIRKFNGKRCLWSTVLWNAPKPVKK